MKIPRMLVFLQCSGEIVFSSMKIPRMLVFLKCSSEVVFSSMKIVFSSMKIPRMLVFLKCSGEVVFSSMKIPRMLVFLKFFLGILGIMFNWGCFGCRLCDDLYNSLNLNLG